MAHNLLSLVSLLLLLLLTTSSFVPHSIQESEPTPTPSSPLASALFVIGDSTVDAGNNNHLGTFARADRPPYGRDFDTHRPTGRFSNGRIIVDYLALRLGLPFVPPFLEQSGRIEDMIHGVSYASAASGIIFSSGSDMGMHISLAEQIQQVTDTLQQFELSLGKVAAADLISKSIFYVSIGSNDFIHYYLKNASNVRSRYQSSEFSQLLAATVKEEIQNLYNANVRKLVVMGLAPVGCAPHYIWYGQSYQDEVNKHMVDFNTAMRYMLSELSRNMSDAMITFCDAFTGSIEILNNRDRYGFGTTMFPCCLLMCIVPELACSNASSFVWWDDFHPTEAVNKILADNVWSGLHTKMCSPLNMKDMIRLNQ